MVEQQQGPPCPRGTLYTIRSGDTLYALSQRFNTTIEAILRANPGIDPRSLRVGQIICIPGRVTPPGPPPRPGRPCPRGTRAYFIGRGDTLYAIARRYNVTVSAILAANPGLDPNRLFVGQRICLPIRSIRPRPGRCPGGFFYTVRAGDTLFAIATRYNTTVSAILIANPGLDPNRLVIGQQICIPVRRTT